MSEKTSNPVVLHKTIRELNLKINNVKQSTNGLYYRLNEKEQEFSKIYNPLISQFPIYRQLIDNIDKTLGTETDDRPSYKINKFLKDNGTRTSLSISGVTDITEISYPEQKIFVSSIEISTENFESQNLITVCIILKDCLDLKKNGTPIPKVNSVTLTIKPKGTKLEHRVENVGSLKRLVNCELFTEPDQLEEVYVNSNGGIIVTEPVFAVFKEKKLNSQVDKTDCVRFEGATPDIPAFIGYAGN